MKNKTILVVSCVFPPEVVTSAITSLDVANRLAQLGASVTVLCPTPSRSVDAGWEYDIEDSINVIHLPSFSGGNSTVMKVFENISFAFSAVTYLSAKKPFDVCYMNAWPIISTSLISAVLRWKKTNYIYSIQDLYPQTLAIKGLVSEGGFLWRVLQNLEKTICDGSAHIITISETFREHVTDSTGVDPQKVTVVSNWSSESVTIQEREEAWTRLSEVGIALESCDLVLGYGGNISDSTGIVEFSRFFLKSSLDIQLLIAGTGSSVNQISRYAEQDKRISLLTPWPKSLTNAMYSVCDILILPVPSGQEHGSLPSKLVNYMNSNLPILCVCDSKCEITYALEEYSAAVVVTWADLDKLRLDDLKALWARKPSAKQDILGEGSEISKDRLVEQILNPIKGN